MLLKISFTLGLTHWTRKFHGVAWSIKIRLKKISKNTKEVKNPTLEDFKRKHQT